MLPLVASISFQIYLFITEVIMSTDDDASISWGLKIAAFVIYGINALSAGGIAVQLFISLGRFDEASV